MLQHSIERREAVHVFFASGKMYTALSFRYQDIHGPSFVSPSWLRGMDNPNADNPDNVFVYVTQNARDGSGLLDHSTMILPLSRELLGQALYELVVHGEETVFMNFSGSSTVRMVSDVFQNALISEEKTDALQDVSCVVGRMIAHVQSEQERFRALSWDDQRAYMISLRHNAIHCRCMLYVMEQNECSWFSSLGSLWGSYYHRQQKEARKIVSSE